MPVVSGLLFPAYHHNLGTAWLEWTKLLEAPFLICELLVICFAIYSGMELRKFIDPLPHDLKIASGLFLIGLWYSSLFVSHVAITSIALSIGTLLHILFAFAVFYFFEKRDNRHFDKFWPWLGIGLLVLVLFTAWRFLLPIPASQVPGGKIEWDFALPGFISVRYFGTWTGAIAMFFIAMVIQRGPIARYSWPEFFMFVSTSMTIWSGTRAAILGMITAFLVMIIAQRRIPDFAVIGRLCIITGAAATAAWIFMLDTESSFWLFSLYDAENLTDSYALTSGRTDLWIATYQKWLEAPLFGLGSGSTFWEIDLGWAHTQPHNAFLQFLMSWGMVGAVGATWLLIRATVAAHKKTKMNPELWPFMAMLYSLLAMSMVDGALYYPRLIMLSMLCYGIILSERGGNSKPTKLNPV